MRNFTKIILVICIMIPLAVNEETVMSQEQNNRPSHPDEVRICANCIIMPIGKYLLIRKGSDYCIIKFTKFWIGDTENDQFAEYESYYQDDKTGYFSNKNVQYRKDKLDRHKPTWSIFGHPMTTGNRNTRCGPIELFWSGRGSVYFHKLGQHQKDYGIEMAPTPWKHIAQIDVFNPHIKWYRYNESRDCSNILIDKIWADVEKKDH